MRQSPSKPDLFIAFIAALFVTAAQARAALGDEPLVIAEGGKTDYVITLPEEPTEVQTTAAGELACFLNQITGATFPIKSETEVPACPEAKLLVIGPSKNSAALLADLNLADTDPAYDQVMIQRVGSSVVLTGHPVRGMLYAVYTFLENDFGCRWWTSSESTIPANASPVIDVTPVDYAPKLILRESFYTDFIQGNDQSGVFAVRMKCNGNSCHIPPQYGSHHSYLYFVHSFYPIIPPEKYFHDHPDWFPEIGGVRKVGRNVSWTGSNKQYDDFVATLQPGQLHEEGTQLCLTNDELFEEMLKRVLADIEANPNVTIVSISQNDWRGYCECEKCRAVDEEEGSHCGTLLRFVNRMADEIKKVRPDLYVDTLAYMYTRKPPKITRARDNVIIRLCSIECSFVQPLGSGEQNKAFHDDMVGWSEKASNIFVWDYATDFKLYLLPFPNYRVVKDNIKFYVDHNVRGLFEQGDYHEPTGDFVQMRGWVVAKLLWNPEADQRALMEEFIAGYYAPQLVPVYMAYFDTLSDACEQSGIHLGIFRSTAHDWLNYDAVCKATALQNQALDIARKLAADDPERYGGLPRKVLRERIPLDLVWAMDWNEYHQEAVDSGKDFPGPKDPLAAAQELFERCSEHGIVKHEEWASPEDYEAFKQSIFDKYR